MKKILLTTDFSDNANRAIEYAMQLFRYDNCQFFVLHVLKASTFISDDLMSMNPTSNLYEQLIASSKLKLDMDLEKIKSKHNNILHEFTPLIDYDNFIDSINQVIEKNDIELIIMGTKGASNIAKHLFGSHTIRVIQGCKIAVLAIPNNYIYKPIDKVVFTSNLENDYCPDDLRAFVDLVERHDYQIDILHISESNTLTTTQENVKVSLQNCFKNATNHFIALSEEPFLKSLMDYIKTNDIDLYAMVNRKHSFLERVFTQQKIEKIAYNITVPFLVL